MRINTEHNRMLYCRIKFMVILTFVVMTHFALFAIIRRPFFFKMLSHEMSLCYRSVFLSLSVTADPLPQIISYILIKWNID
jgi:hypothetical protein